MRLFSRSSKSTKEVYTALDRSCAIIQFDLKGTILETNDNFCKTMGYAAAELVGKHHSMFCDPEDVKSPDYARFWADLAAGTYKSGEFRRLDKAGKDIWLEASYNPVPVGGRPHRVVKVASDITARKLASLEAEARMAALSRVQAVIEFTPGGEILDANENFLKVFGYTLAEIRGKHHRMLCPPDFTGSPAYGQLWERLRGGEFVAQEFERRSKSGAPVWIQASYNPVTDGRGRVCKVVKFATDITGRITAADRLASGLQALAERNLAFRIDQPFIPALDRVRNDFNTSAGILQDALLRVLESGDMISERAGTLLGLNSDLADRTGKQAAAVEETTAAMQQIAINIKDNTHRAEEMGDIVKEAQVSANRSGEVVGKTISAMGAIEESSQRISSIIGVIDEIAFQTNLLALNAGVEAARAGEAGKGFAVVAQEVRELAQRSGNAAKEIKTLINASSDQVRSGVALVDESGKVLSTIASQVDRIGANIAAIVVSTREQATGLDEINRAIKDIDRSAHENREMVNRSRTASESLAGDAEDLRRMVGAFHLGGGAAPRRTAPAPTPARRTESRPVHHSVASVTARAAPVQPAPSPARALQQRVAAVTSASTAADTNTWEEF